MRINAAYPPRVAALFIFSAAITVISGCSSHAEIAEPPRSAIVAQATPATAAVAEVYSGDVHARFESQLGFRISGKIKARLVDVGAQVIAGQVLAELDPQDMQLQVASARATLASAEADAALAKSERDRYHALLEKHFVSQTDFDAKDNVFKAATARVTEVRSALSINQNQAGYASLRADHAGAITTINAEVGQVVAAGQTIATLAHDGEIEAEISVPENRIGKYKAGTPATVELWADAGKQIPGHLREIAPEADPVTRTFRVRVGIDQNGAPLRFGQTVRVYFVDAAGAGLQALPLSALHERDGKPALWVFDPKTKQVHLVPVEVNAYREDSVIIASGIAAQQWIVTAGVHTLHEGQNVRPVDRNNKAVML